MRMRLPATGIVVLIAVVAAVVVAKFVFKVSVMFAFGKYTLVLIGIIVLVALFAPMFANQDDEDR